LLVLHREAESGRPAVDLRMIGGKGFIRGSCGVEDRGYAFSEVSEYLIELAGLEGDFDWNLYVDIDRVMTSSVRSVLVFAERMSDLANEQGFSRKLTLHWSTKSPAAKGLTPRIVECQGGNFVVVLDS
jgi:hypothetical protein